LYVVSRGERAERQALQIARQLRLAGRRVELDLSGSAFGKQFKRADRTGARWALVLGESEVEAGVVIVKDLRATSEAQEERVALEELPKRFA
jgi:histidyl-tRNA synthetase